jgi:FSR family fosmidomycin resistance protein-like MFS transporter
MAVILRWFVPPVKADGKEQAAPRASVSGHAARKTLLVLFSASTLRAWAAFTAIAFLPLYLIGLGYTLFSANLLISLMLLAGVASQIVGGIISDRWGRKEFVITGLLLSIPVFILFLLTSGVLQIACLILFGLTLWSSFAITVAMSHEIMPDQIGLTSGLKIGVAIGAGGLGVAVSGLVADAFSLQAALMMLPVLIAAAAILVALMQYPWRSARIHAGV